MTQPSYPSARILDESAPVLSLTRASLAAAQARGVILVDTRDEECFAAGHWPGSLNVPLFGPFALWAALALEPDVEVALISEPGTECAARNQLARLGHVRIFGVLAGGLGPLDAARLVSRRPAQTA